VRDEHREQPQGIDVCARRAALFRVHGVQFKERPAFEFLAFNRARVELALERNPLELFELVVIDDRPVNRLGAGDFHDFHGGERFFRTPVTAELLDQRDVISAKPKSAQESRGRDLRGNLRPFSVFDANFLAVLDDAVELRSGAAQLRQFELAAERLDDRSAETAASDRDIRRLPDLSASDHRRPFFVRDLALVGGQRFA
jgi:hypothetical protein